MSGALIHLLYFGELGDKLQLAEEQWPLLADCKTVSDLVRDLIARGPLWQHVLGQSQHYRIAVNQHLVGLDYLISDGDELAIFSQITGG